MPAIETYEFPNGFRVIHQKPMSTIPVSSVCIFCDVGPVHEEGVRGISHFIEHMCFKGTKKIPQSKAISLEFDNVGAKFNAHTAKRFTYYDIKCKDDYVLHCLAILSDMLLNSVFNKGEFEKEERVVMEENVRSNDDNTLLLYDNIDEILYKDTPYEFPIDTTLYHKKRFDYKTVIDFYRRFYQPSRMILSVVTHVDFRTICKFLKSNELGKRKTASMPISTPALYAFPKVYCEPQYNIQKKPGVNVTYLSVSFRTCERKSIDRYVLYILKEILSGRSSSRLWMLLRENNGLTYASSAEANNNETSGEFMIYTELDPRYLLKAAKNKPGVLPLIVELIVDLVKHGVTNEEIIQTKQYIQGLHLLHLENAYTSAFHNGKELLLTGERIVPYDQLYDVYYKNVTKKQVDDAIRKYFLREQMCVCVLGDTLPSEKAIRDAVSKI